MAGPVTELNTYVGQLYGLDRPATPAELEEISQAWSPMAHMVTAVHPVWFGSVLWLAAGLSGDLRHPQSELGAPRLVSQPT